MTIEWYIESKAGVKGKFVFFWEPNLRPTMALTLIAGTLKIQSFQKVYRNVKYACDWRNSVAVGVDAVSR